MKLNELLESDIDVEIKGIKINSKLVEPGDLFVCTMGATVDRHDFITDAIKNGASAIIVSKDVDYNIPTIKVKNTNEILPLLCKKFYNYSDKKLKLIGITGTDGKTSTTTILQTLIGNNKCGYIGTNGYSCSKFNKVTENTTPSVEYLYKYFNEFVESKCEYVSMEVSSEAIYYGRVKDLKYDVAAITNITSEHLNTHKTLENYIECKKQLFKQVKKGGTCILNKDDEQYENVLNVCKEKVLTYGRDKDCDLVIKEFKLYPNKTDIVFNYLGKDYVVDSPLLGDFNVYNLACSLLCGISLGYQMEYMIPHIKNINVNGRLDMINLGQDYYVMVDYAHTPNGISKLLNFVKTLNINKSIVVIGQAGDRDPYKREIVGKIVSDNCDEAIFTYEDPRSEKVEDIISMMIKNIDKNNYKIIYDRKEAIKYAINLAEPHDMVMILGKGNETYEKLNTGKIYFNDEEEAKEAIKERKLKRVLK